MTTSIQAFNNVFNGFRAQDSFFRDQVKTITFTIESAGTIDPVTGSRTGQTTTTYSAEGFRRDIRKDEFNDIEANDLVFTCQQSELGREPIIGDKPVIDGDVYRVINYRDLGQVAWAMQLRR